ncbi:helix-turn-helix domain-containing protein [Sungkyunkwania multivorans]|uniref:Helix-turn-helix domain-containing protein n=1 Tax=Sungkyunkwania multivorans TaxID=1173618 RepID=A0ABW3D0R8_9FLAO
MAQRLGKSYNMVSGCVQNRQQPHLETLMEIAQILDVDIKELIMSTKENK